MQNGSGVLRCWLLVGLDWESSAVPGDREDCFRNRRHGNELLLIAPLAFWSMSSLTLVKWRRQRRWRRRWSLAMAIAVKNIFCISVVPSVSNQGHECTGLVWFGFPVRHNSLLRIFVMAKMSYSLSHPLYCFVKKMSWKFIKCLLRFPFNLT